VEADSGGHTDNRPLMVLLPTIMSLRDACIAEHGFERGIRVGAAGGLGEPSAVAAAFALGAAYVVTGSVNQACVQSGLSEVGRRMLAEAGVADVGMAPASDMFEMGVKLQVLKRGTVFAARALMLYDAWVRYGSLDALPTELRERMEREVFQRPLAAVWDDTRRFWLEREPEQAAKAERDRRQQMALVCRWYLGLSSRWAIAGDEERRLDFQIWCGPAMGAFNAWVAGSFLAPPEKRDAIQVALNLMEGAAQVTRAQQLRSLGLVVPPGAYRFRPRHLALA
jgi:trans-AT polyketide synthase, acyltransferase and oxidoreductase domains